MPYKPASARLALQAAAQRPSRFQRYYPRDNRWAQIILCVLLGLAVGAVTIGLHEIVTLAHRFAFKLPPGEHLSAAMNIQKSLLVAVPVIGGLLLGLFNRKMKQLRPGDIVDPIEANAIFGGRMSITDSLRLLAATLISNGSGISVGMEAAYTQVGACITSWGGRKALLRREDVRTFVAAGAAAAIAAAYNAPMAGAFYGFELVLGNYVISALPQVTLCALSATILLRLVEAGDPIFSLPLDNASIPAQDYALFTLVGIASGVVGILTMKAVTGCERIFRKSLIPEHFRPAVGGLIVGMLAFSSPQILGSGQGGIDSHLHAEWAVFPLVLLLFGKIMASAISIGSGFRGGLFSASLFLGCLLGQLAGLVAAHYIPVSPHLAETLMLVGTGSVAASIVGAPMTMVLLVLEMTGNFPATTGVLAGVLVSSTFTRYSFGYSFATWRFHLRGLAISDARDIGWLKDITVERLMLKSPPTASVDTPIAELKERFPPGSRRNVFLTDAKGRYHGMVSVAEMHSPDLVAREAELRAGDIARGLGNFLLPGQDIQEALSSFGAARLEELPVIASERNPQILGYAREVQFLKRYSQEFEAHHLPQAAEAPAP